MKKLWNKVLVLAAVTAALLTVSAFAAQGETGDRKSTRLNSSHQF